MTADRQNEIIARWRGAKTFEEWAGDNMHPPKDGDLCIDSDTRISQACPNGVWKYWSPSTDITLWHNDGLLAEIERSELRNDFMRNLVEILNVFGCLKRFLVLFYQPRSLLNSLLFY